MLLRSRMTISGITIDRWIWKLLTRRLCTTHCLNNLTKSHRQLVNRKMRYVLLNLYFHNFFLNVLIVKINFLIVVEIILYQIQNGFY